MSKSVAARYSRSFYQVITAVLILLIIGLLPLQQGLPPSIASANENVPVSTQQEMGPPLPQKVSGGEPSIAQGQQPPAPTPKRPTTRAGKTDQFLDNPSLIETYWSSGGPYGASVRELVISPAYADDEALFVGSWGSGIFRYSGYNSEWDSRNQGLEKELITALAISPDFANDDTLFAATCGGKVYISTDGANNWNEAINGLPGNTTVYEIGVSPAYTSDQTLYAGVGNSILYRSQDRAQSWFPVNFDLPPATVLELEFEPSFVLTGVVYARLDNQTIYRADDGETWTSCAPLPGGRDAWSMDLSPDGSILFVGTNDGILSSTTQCQDWSLSNTGIENIGLEDIVVSPDLANDQTLWGCNDSSGVYRSTDAGLNWTRVLTGADDGIYCGRLAVSPDFATDGRVFAGSQHGFGGVYVSSDGGEHWQRQNNGLTWNILDLAASPDYANDQTVYAGLNGGGVFRSTNRGRSWGPANAGYLIGADAVAVALSPQYDQDGTIFAGGYGTGVSQSTDQGETWEQVGLAGVYGILEIAISPGAPLEQSLILVGTTEDGAYRSDDGGSSWLPITGGLAITTVSEVAFSPDYIQDQTIFLATDGQGLFRSLDGGEAWDLLSGGLLGSYVWSIGLSPDWANDRTLLVGTDEGLFRSLDGGDTWVELSFSELYGVSEIAFSPGYASDRTIWVATNLWTTEAGGGIFVSEDGGDSWRQVNEGLSEKKHAALAVGTLNGSTYDVFVGTPTSSTWQRYSDTDLLIRARGTPAAGEWPRMQVRVNDTIVADWFVNTLEYTLWLTRVNLTGQDQVDIWYPNDGVVGDENRDLYIDYIQVEDTVINPADTSQVIFDEQDTSTTDLEAFNGFVVTEGSLALDARGALRFSVGIAPVLPQHPQGLPIHKVISDTIINDTWPSPLAQWAVAIDGNASGDAVVVWRDYRDERNDVYAQRLTSTGTLGNNFRVNDNADWGSQKQPDVLVNDDGSFVIVWARGYPVSGAGHQIYGQRYDSAGIALGANFSVTGDMGTYVYPDVDGLGDGSFVIVWAHNWGGTIWGQRYDTAGQPLAPIFRIDNASGDVQRRHARVAVSNAGSFLVVWQDPRNGDMDIYGQWYDASGNTVNTNFRINDDPGLAEQVTPDVTVDGSGNYVVVWRDRRQGNEDIYVQRYDAARNPLGSNFQVNDDLTVSRQHAPRVSASEQGSFIVTWWDRRSIQPDVYAQYFDQEGWPIGRNFKLDDSQGTQEYGPDVAMSGPREAWFAWYGQAADYLDVFANRWASTDIYTVTSTADGGVGSLRWALQQAGPYAYIHFDPVVFPPASPATITPLSALPYIITDGLTVDGSNAGVILSGSQLTGTIVDGLHVEGADSVTIQGLQIIGFPDNGLDLRNGASYALIGGSQDVGSAPLGQGNLISGNGGDGISVEDAGSDHNQITGNYIGTDLSGTSSMSNTEDGIAIRYGASGNWVENNLLSGNGVEGICLNGVAKTTIRGNLIGTDYTGMAALGNASTGVDIVFGATETRLEDNVISDNGDYGVQLYGIDTTSNTIVSNLIGTNISGTSAVSNTQDGLLLQGGTSGNLIEDNLISGNGDDGIQVQDSMSNTIRDNRVGTDYSGMADLGNGSDGVLLLNGFNNQVEDNLISGNAESGVHITGDQATGNIVIGNYVGTSLDGTAAIANYHGIRIAGGASWNTIGGTTLDERNILSGNERHGVTIYDSGSSHNHIIGNYIGTNISGTEALPNAEMGVNISSGATNNVIGGGSFADGNLISGNGTNGVHIASTGTSSNTVAYNYIGVDRTGMSAIPNSLDGVSIRVSAVNNIITGNLISGNGDEGVVVGESGPWGNQIAGNIIGLNINKTLPLPNAGRGVWIYGGALRSGVGPGNIIAYNGQEGVQIDGSSTLSHTITQNSIYNNTAAGILLSNGANGGIASPTILDANWTTVVGTAAPNTTIEVFSDNNGQGRVYEGNAQANGSGQWSLTASGRFTGPNLTATATDSAGNTSEFSVPFPIPTTSCTVDSTADSGMGTLRWCLNQAQSYDDIDFDPAVFPPTAPVTILLNSALPYIITAGLTIDGSSAGVILDGSLLTGTVDGLHIDSADYVTIQGLQILNFPGDGVELASGAGYARIGGDRGIGNGPLGQGNLISGNGDNGIYLQGSVPLSNTIIGNYIGTNLSGTIALSNADNGIMIQYDAFWTCVEGNLISGNGDDGIEVWGTGSHIIVGNRIGTNRHGNASIPNGSSGIRLKGGTSWNTVGGPAPNERNLISGNNTYGIVLADGGTSHNTISGNYIGTNVSGTAPLPNLWSGVYIWSGPTDNIIGGDDVGSGNLISGNNDNGVRIGITAHNTVSHNYIGTDYTGNNPIANNSDGIEIRSGATNNLITGNVVSGNGENGVYIFGVGTQDNQIAGNKIGTNATGELPLPNGPSGIHIMNGATESMIGPDNIIAHNWRGVWVQNSDTLSHTITQNSIYSNTDKGIYLDDGGNGELPSPTTLTATWTIASGEAPPNSVVEIFSDNANQGRIYEISTTASALGQWTVSRPGGFTGPNLTATATDPAGNTSEFSAPYLIPFDLCTVDSSADSGVGTLRWCLLHAPAYGYVDFDPTTFPIATPATILLASALPYIITDGLSIDASDAGVILDGSQLTGAVDGLHIDGADSVIVQGLQIIGFPGDGIQLSGGAAYNFIGGDRSLGDGPLGQGNLISGNGDNGVYIRDTGSISNTIIGNYIGTNLWGTQVLSNTVHGIWIGAQSSETWVVDNLISGNGSSGIHMENTVHNIVRDNRVGTDLTGLAALGNQGAGIYLSWSCDENLVTENLVSGNQEHGIALQVALSNTITNNYIGTNVSGTQALGNMNDGINLVNDAAWNSIENNLVSGNGRIGIFLDGGSNNNVIRGNRIGTDYSGAILLGNAYSGINVGWQTFSNLIEANLIKGNGEHGVRLFNGTKQSVVGPNNVIALNSVAGVYVNGSDTLSNTITQNSIYDNVSQGIALSGGGNGELPSPIISSAGWTMAAGTALPNSIVEVFSDDADEGRMYEGSVQADGDGQWDLFVTGPFEGPNLTATATDPAGNTSEFSLPYPIPTSICTVNNADSSGDGTLRWCLNRIEPGGFINFDPTIFSPTMPTSITLLSALPSIVTNSVTIDASNAGVILDGSQLTGSEDGLFISDANGVRIWGLQIIGFPDDGIELTNGTQLAQIGGDCKAGTGHLGQGNLISGNDGDGVSINGSTTMNNTIEGNWVGIAWWGTTVPSDTCGVQAAAYPFEPRMNGGDGISVYNEARDSRIGANNIIAFNAVNGVHVDGSYTFRHLITTNVIYSNTSQGILLSNGANENIDQPTILTATWEVAFGQAQPSVTVQLFSDAGSQGRFYEGTTAAKADGTWSISPQEDRFTGPHLTAIATDQDGNSSEFSAPFSELTPTQMVSWTFMVYLNGDNNLDTVTDDLFNNLEFVANKPNVHILVVWDRYTPTGGLWLTETYFYEVQYDTNLGQLANYTEGVNRWYLGEWNMGEKQAVVDFVHWVKSRYPAEHYFLSIFDHGGGWAPEFPAPQPPPRRAWSMGGTGLSWDDTNQVDYLSTYELGWIFDSIGHMDVVFYDACLMAMLENAYEIRNHVDFLIASENLAFATVPYSYYVSIITTTTIPENMAASVADLYIRSLPPNSSGSITVFKLDETEAIVAAVDDLAEILLSLVPYTSTREQIASAYLSSQKVDYDDDWVLESEREGFVDLYHFAQQLLTTTTDTQAISAAQSLLTAVDESDFIWFEEHQSGYPYTATLQDLHGTSIYMPFGEELYIGRYCPSPTTLDICEVPPYPICVKLRDYYTTTTPPQNRQLRFAQSTHWDELVQAFVNTYYNCNGTSHVSFMPAGTLPGGRPIEIRRQMDERPDEAPPPRPPHRIYLPLVLCRYVEGE